MHTAKNFQSFVWLARMSLKIGLGINKIFGREAMVKLTRGIKKIIPVLPIWSNRLGHPPHLSALKLKKQITDQAVESKVVYYPSCITRIMGTYEGKKKNLMETFISICNKSGIEVLIPDNINNSCCSQIFSSKGLFSAYRYTANNIVEQLWKTSREGTLPIVIDVSSCTYTLHHIRPVLENDNKSKFDQLTILDSVDFLHDMIMPFIDVKARKKDIVLHPVCSLEKMKTENKFLTLARHFADEVTMPINAGCCGMAGDRGFLFPELTGSATKPEATEVKQKNYDGYYSSTKTCEMAMSDAVEKNYESILFLVDEGL